MGKSFMSTKNDERGLVSIIVTFVMIIIMTLIVLSMSQNSNREQRQALDRQLSDQAFYNAETGINDWAKYLYENKDNPSLGPEKTDCDPGPNSQIDGPNGVNKYTCILYDRAPKTLEYSDLSVFESIIVPIKPIASGGGSTLRQMVFKWSAAEANTVTTGCNFTAGASLPASLPNNCNVGGFEMSLVPQSGSRSAIQSQTFTAYVLPGAGGGAGTVGYSATGVESQGVIATGQCNATECALRLNNLNIPYGQEAYLHLKGLYNKLNLRISGCSDNGVGNCNADPYTSPANIYARFSDAQYMIDSTGKAADVLRRVQVRLPAKSQFEISGSTAVRSVQSICKLITIESDPASGGYTATPNDARCVN